MKSHRTMRCAHVRRGVTLSEVLVSMLVMSLGVISVFTLFPISVMRSIQATQLTNATLLRHNAEARIEFDAEAIHGTYNWSSNWDITGIQGPMWVMPTINGSTKAWRKTNPNIVCFRSASGTTGTAAPTWPTTTGATVMDGGVTWEAVSVTNYLIDPVGCRTWAALGQTDLAIGRIAPSFYRLDGRGYDALAANEIAGLPDSWTTLFSDVLTSVSPSPDYRLNLKNPSNLDVMGTPINSNNRIGTEYRVLVFDDTGKYAVKRGIYDYDTSGYLVWKDPNKIANDFPANFNATRVQLDARETRYTWMLTVRKKPDALAAVDVVVFFNRSFDPNKDERVYVSTATEPITYSVNYNNVSTGGADGQPGVADFDDDLDGTTDNASELGWQGSDDNRTIDITWTGTAPFLKKGGFILDASLGNWYRVVDFSSTGTTSAQLLVDRDLISIPQNDIPRLVFYRGVVEVYPLGMRIAP